MADLLDIVSATACETVTINGEDVIVSGLNAPALATLAKRFPEIVRSLSGAAVNGGDNSDMGWRMCTQIGQATGPIIAAGLGKLGDEKYEQAAASLALDYQLELIGAVLRVTFPNGFDSFVKKLAALMQADERAEPVKKVRLKTSPSQSPPLSNADSPPNMQ